MSLWRRQPREPEDDAAVDLDLGHDVEAAVLVAGNDNLAVIEELFDDEPITPATSIEQAPNDDDQEDEAVVSEAVNGLPAPAGPADPAPSAERRARIVCVANQKGGVGKTTSAVSVAAALAQAGAEVLLVDLDPQANATTGLGLRAAEGALSTYSVLVRGADAEDASEPTSVRGLYVIPASLDLAGAEIELVPTFSREHRLSKALEPLRPDYDVMIVDCPPSLGLITINALAAADEVLVPIQCEYYALEGISQLTRTLQMVSDNLNQTLNLGAIVLTMFDARTKLAHQVVDEVRSYYGELVMRTVIPRAVRLSEAPSFGQPITVFDPSSRGARAYTRLAHELAERWNIKLDTESTLDWLLADETEDADDASVPEPDDHDGSAETEVAGLVASSTTQTFSELDADPESEPAPVAEAEFTFEPDVAPEPEADPEPAGAEEAEGEPASTVAEPALQTIAAPEEPAPEEPVIGHEAAHEDRLAAAAREARERLDHLAERHDDDFEGEIMPTYQRKVED